MIPFDWGLQYDPRGFVMISEMVSGIYVVQFDEAEQVITGQRIEISAAGNRLFPYVLRYASPDQMDDMATAAGLRLEDRSEDWHGATFDDSSPAHVSVWSKP